jgi:histidinol phosphatase-like PHP family hydrolase
LSRLIRTDLHVHTNLSDCGDAAATFEAVVAAGLEAELEAIGLADHIFFPNHRERAPAARRALPAEVDGMRIYVGAEVDMQSPTRAAIDAEFAERLDYVNVACSHLYDPGVVRNFIDEPRSMAAYMIELMRGAIDLGFADIIVHPLHVPACRHDFADLVTAVDHDALRGVARAAAEAGVAIECNPRFVRSAPIHAKWLFGLFLREGCKLAINSDSHHPRGIGCRGPSFATEDELRAIGITEDNVFTLDGRVTKAVG